MHEVILVILMHEKVSVCNGMWSNAYNGTQGIITRWAYYYAHKLFVLNIQCVLVVWHVFNAWGNAGDNIVFARGWMWMSLIKYHVHNSCVQFAAKCIYLPYMLKRCCNIQFVEYLLRTKLVIARVHWPAKQCQWYVLHAWIHVELKTTKSTLLAAINYVATHPHQSASG